MFLFLVPTYECNMGCTYCMQKKVRDYEKVEFFNLDTFRKNINTLFTEWPELKKEFNSIKFHGGEFTLAPVSHLLEIKKIWAEEYGKVFCESLDNLYVSGVSNGYRFVKEPEYLKEYLDAGFEVAISYDLYSQTAVRSPTISTDQFEDMFDIILSFKKSLYILAQISQHSIDHREEYLKYLEHFIKKYSGRGMSGRLREIQEFDSNPKEKIQIRKVKRFYEDIFKLTENLAEQGYSSLLGYYFYLLGLNDSSVYSSCSITSNGCWANNPLSMGNVTYSNDRFWLGCIRPNNGYSFINRAEYEQCLLDYSKNLETKRAEYCKGCKYLEICSPCLFEFETGNVFYKDHNCRTYLKNFIKKEKNKWF